MLGMIPKKQPSFMIPSGVHVYSVSELEAMAIEFVDLPSET